MHSERLPTHTLQKQALSIYIINASVLLFLAREAVFVVVLQE